MESRRAKTNEIGKVSQGQQEAIDDRFLKAAAAVTVVVDRLTPPSPSLGWDHPVTRAAAERFGWTVSAALSAAWVVWCAMVHSSLALGGALCIQGAECYSALPKECT